MTGRKHRRRELARLDALIEAGARKDLRIPDDWIYEDVEWCDLARWNAFVPDLSSGEVVLIARTVNAREGRVRGQAFWSPDVIELKRAHFAAAGSA